jgi:Na+/proline symporter
MDNLSNKYGIQGLFLACLFSAVLSSMSSCLNSITTVLVEYTIKEFLKKEVDEKTKTKWSKITC